GDAECGGDRSAGRRLLLVDPVVRCRGQGIGGERKESLYHRGEGKGKNRTVARHRTSDPARTRDRSDGQDRGGSARHGEWQGSADRRRRWWFPLFHAALAERGKRDHDHGAERERRCEYPPGES